MTNNNQQNRFNFNQMGSFSGNYVNSNQNPNYMVQFVNDNSGAYAAQYGYPMMVNQPNMTPMYVADQVSQEMVLPTINVNNQIYTSQVNFPATTENQPASVDFSVIQNQIPLHIREIFKEVITYVQQSNGPVAATKDIIVNFLAGKINPEVFIMNMNYRNIFRFSATQQKSLLDYYANLQNLMKNSLKETEKRINDSSQSQIRRVLTPQQKNPNISTPLSTNPVRIPQLTMVQNNNRSTIQNQFRLSQVIRQPTPNLLKELSDQHEAALNQLTKQEENLPEMEEEEDFDFCGVNIKDEEKIIAKFENYTQLKPSSQCVPFNTHRIINLIHENCNEKKLAISDETANKIALTLSYGLEIKLRQILQKSTLYVHHRLKNFELKGKHYLMNSLETQFGVLEEIAMSKDSKKDKIKKSKTELSKKNEAGKGSMDSSFYGRGSRKSDLGNPYNDARAMADASMHRRNRNSAQQQRKIFKKDLVNVFQSDTTIKKYLLPKYNLTL